MHWATFIVLLGALGQLLGCSMLSREEQVARLEGHLFPVLEEERVTAYRYQRWCKVLEDPRGAFASNPRGTCTYPLEGEPATFDGEATRRLERIRRTLRACRLNLRSIHQVHFDARGRVRYAVCEEEVPFGRQRLIYDRGYERLPDDMPQERVHRAVNADWYHVWEDWN